MAEQRIIVDHLTVSYSGIFNITELYQEIDNFMREKGYDRRELRNQEHVTPEGKYIELELQPWKKVSDYVRHNVRILIRMLKVKEVTVEIDGKKRKMHKGKVYVIIDGIMYMDFEGRWEQRPFYFFLRTIFDKFIYRTYTGMFEDLLVETCSQLQLTIKSYLNLYKHTHAMARSPRMEPGAF
ncbi:hypothetical protein HYY74_05640 [Candidatus Woesearchaeota archaeon]|nr:hypothetical protein [Candidatus Woesearchaeota archaeon]